MELIQGAFERVAKKQKLSCSKTQEVLDRMDKEIKHTLRKIQSSNECASQVDFVSVIAELRNKFNGIATRIETESAHKELYLALSKYPKLLEKSFNPDITKAYRNVEFNSHTINEIIGNHFCRQGCFELGDYLLSEAGEPESAAVMKSQFQEMFQIVEPMKRHNLEPAFNWAIANSDKLKSNGSDILLQLHSLQFMSILQKGDKDGALDYAKMYLAPCASDHMAEFQKLIVTILWIGKLDKSPFFHLLSNENWEKVTVELTRQFCNILGQSYENPLSMTIAAGVQALPHLLKFMNVMVGKKNEWQRMKQLPVPVELDREFQFQFHSIFVCPVSKDQATDENPPMLMSCGHVLCKHSILKMPKNGTKTFKCPYCPSDISSAQCRQLHF